jgi:hypothetical protein
MLSMWDYAQAGNLVTLSITAYGRRSIDSSPPHSQILRRWMRPSRHLSQEKQLIPAPTLIPCPEHPGSDSADAIVDAIARNRA